MAGYRIAAAAVVAVAVVACGGGGGGESRPSTTRATTITTYGGTPGAAQSLGCEQDVRTLQQASDLYAASKGAPAASLQILADEGYIDQAPSNDHGYAIGYDVATGKVSAKGACTYP